MAHTLAILGKYTLGVFLWFGLAALLRTTCWVDVYSFVDGIGMTVVNGDLTKNFVGEIALRVPGSRCGMTYVYSVSFDATRLDISGETRSLTSLVDVKTWREIGSDSTTVTYVDTKLKYVLHRASGDVYIRATNK